MTKQDSSQQNDLEDIPPMSTMQKVIIGLAIAAVVAFVAYTVLH